MKKIIYKENGQVALVVLIVSAVVLTLGLSTSRRSVTENKITTDEGSLKEAFNVAESGIEYYLGTGNREYIDTTNHQGEARANINTTNITSDANNVMEYNEETLRNNILNFWLVAHDTNHNIDWLNSGNYAGGNDIQVCVNNSFTGGLMVNYFFGTDLSRSDYGVRRLAFNIDSNGMENFEDPEGGDNSCGQGRQLVETIATQAGTVPILVTVKPIVSSARVALRTTSALPIQGEEISSTAVVGEQSTGTRKTIRVLRRYEVPQFMLDSITAEVDISAN